MAGVALNGAVTLPQFGGAMLRPCQVCPWSDLTRLTEIALILQFMRNGGPECWISDLLVERCEIAGPNAVEILGFQSVVQAVDERYRRKLVTPDQAAV